MTVGPQATFVVEYPCDRFCRIEVELSGDRPQTTLQQMWDRAEDLHRREHEPESAEAAAPVPEQPEAVRRPAATVFRSAPARSVDRRR